MWVEAKWTLPHLTQEVSTKHDSWDPQISLSTRHRKLGGSWMRQTKITCRPLDQYIGELGKAYKTWGKAFGGP